MRYLMAVVLTVLCACASDRQGSAVTAPEPVSGRRVAQSSDEPTPRNIGTQVWLAPAPAGDMLHLVQHPELWVQAQKRVDVVALYFLQAYHHEGFICGTPCGPNTYLNLNDAVPDGALKWFSDRFQIALEGGSVKSHSCTEKKIREDVGFQTNIAIANIKKAGGRLSFMSMDEPFTSGVATIDRNPFGQDYVGCGLSGAEVAQLQRAFNETVHAEHPEVRIGFIEAYPFLSPDEIVSFMLELEHADVPIPYFHLDLHLKSAVRQHRDVVSDVRRIREFFAARGIPFGIIIAGEDGTSNAGFAGDSWALARFIAATTGATEHTLFQSWAESDPGNLNSLKNVPNAVPETDPFSHTGLLLRILEFLGVQPTP